MWVNKKEKITEVHEELSVKIGRRSGATGGGVVVGTWWRRREV